MLEDGSLYALNAAISPVTQSLGFGSLTWWVYPFALVMAIDVQENCLLLSLAQDCKQARIFLQGRKTDTPTDKIVCIQRGENRLVICLISNKKDCGDYLIQNIHSNRHLLHPQVFKHAKYRNGLPVIERTTRSWNPLAADRTHEDKSSWNKSSSSMSTSRCPLKAVVIPSSFHDWLGQLSCSQRTCKGWWWTKCWACSR